MGIVFLYVFLVGDPDSLSIQLLLLTVVRLVEVLKEDLCIKKHKLACFNSLAISYKLRTH